MSGIFSESYRVLEPGGVITVYFTDKETGAWDALTMSLINSGFTVTATHTITSEMPHRVGMQDRSSADSTLLLTCRKPDTDIPRENKVPTLWEDIKEETERAARRKATELLESNLNLTKTDTIISAFGPTLRVFTENYPVVDKHDNPVRPAEALETARTAVTEVLIDRELENNLEGVDGLTKWYVLMYLVYGRDTVPYDEANQLGMGVGVSIDELKRDTKIWKKSGDTLILVGQSDRVRNLTALESGEKRRKRAFPVDPREESFDYNIDATHAVLNVIETKGSEYAWNWLNERDYQNNPSFRQTIRSLAQVLPESHEDFDPLVNLLSGDTGDLLDIDIELFTKNDEDKDGDNHSLDEY
jgi:adenine-specific DNA methylase